MCFLERKIEVFFFCTKYLQGLISIHCEVTEKKNIMWVPHHHLRTSFMEPKQFKYKFILSIKTIGSCGPTCVVWLKSCVFLKRKLALFVGNSHMICMLRNFLEFNTPVIFPNFLSNWVNLLGIFSSCEKLRAFERNLSFWNSCLMSWRPIV